MQERMREFLDDRAVTYSISFHKPAYTATQAAAFNHTPARRMAKTVVFVADGDYFAALLPADMRVDCQRLTELLRAGHVRLASEEEIQSIFPGSEPGGLPPFTNIYGLPVFIDEHLVNSPTIAVNGGSAAEAIELHSSDLIRLSDGVVTRFAQPCVP